MKILPAIIAPLAALWFFNPAAFAKQLKPTDYTIAVATDRAEPFYKQGETVTFTITATKQGEPLKDAKVKWKISKDGVEPPLQEGTASPENGTFTVSGKLDEPGFLQCRADMSIPGESIPTGRAAAAIDPLAIKPSMPPPDDFDAFWAEQKKQLAAIPLNIKMTPIKTMEGVDSFDVQADCVGQPMSGYLSKPKGAASRSLPAMVLCHGAGVASSRLSLTAEWAKEGFLVLDFNAHGLPNGKPPSFYSSLYKAELDKYYLKNPESRETTFFLGLFLRLMRAIDVLTSQPEWDGQILIANGRSQGGAQSIAAAGLEPRVTFLAAQIPALCDHTGITAGRINGWPKFLQVANDQTREKILQASRYYDAVNFAGRTKAGAIFTAGFIDVTCPPTGIYAAYNNLSGPKHIVNYFHTGHVATPEADAAVKSAILAYLTEARLKKP